MNLLKFIFASCIGIIFATSTSKALTSLRRVKRVARGKLSSIEEFPYLVSLEYKKSDFNCAGTVISPTHIITAAHCIHPKESPNSYQVRTGSSTMLKNGATYAVLKLARHENFRALNQTHMIANDLAILKLKTPIAFDNKTTKSIDMFDSGEETKTGDKAVVPGWGLLSDEDLSLPERVHTVELKILDKNRCSQFYDFLGGLQPGEICTSFDVTNFQSICHGDSGGPLVIDGRLAGIASLGHCATSTHPDIFTEVAHFRDWIDRQIKLL